jgi:hypothetical protein
MAEMAGDWTEEQNDAIVADYFMMLADIADRPYSTAEHTAFDSRHLFQLAERKRPLSIRPLPTLLGDPPPRA